MEVLCFGLEASTFAVTRAHLFELVVLLSRHPLQFQGRVQSFATPASVAPWRANITVRLLSALHVMRSWFPGNANRFPCIHLPRIPRLCAQQPCRRQVRSVTRKTPQHFLPAAVTSPVMPGVTSFFRLLMIPFFTVVLVVRYCDI